MTRKRRYPTPGQPRRAGDQPIVRVEVRFGESEVLELDEARGTETRSEFIRASVRERIERENTEQETK